VPEGGYDKSATAFAGIDLGSRGVKAFVYRFVTEEEGLDARPLFSHDINTRLVNSAVGNQFIQSGIDEAVAAVTKLMGEMKDFAAKEKLDPSYYIVASSGVARFQNHADLKAAVDKATGLSMDFVDAATEGLYGLKSAVPTPRRDEGLHVDIGSSNTKVGCMVGNVYNPVEVPFGSVTLRKAVPAGDYTTNLPSFVASTVAPAYNTQRMNTPCLGSRTRIYFIGGAAWAMTTFEHPEAALWGYVPIRLADVDDFLRHLSDGSWNQAPLQFHFGPNVTAAQQGPVRAAAAVAFKKVQDTFPREDLMAGASLLKLILTQGNPKAQARFVRNANYLFGYALDKFSGIKFASK
jgi:hypothetical protein